MGGCERCGRLDSTLRATSFIYTISVILMTFRRGSGGVYCSSCRKKEGVKWTLVSAVMGWWGFPWGPIYTLQAIGRNSSGGYQDSELNGELLQAVAVELIERGDKPGAIEALEESLRLHDDGNARQFLWSLQGEEVSASEEASTEGVATASPATPSFAPGALVRAIAASLDLYSQPDPDSSASPVGTLGGQTAVVTRAHRGWVELQVPGGTGGWVSERSVEPAA